jgi:hypothetical protein
MKLEREGEALPKRQRIATGDAETAANSEWRIVNGFDHPPEVGGYYLGCALRVES